MQVIKQRRTLKIEFLADHLTPATTELPRTARITNVSTLQCHLCLPTDTLQIYRVLRHYLWKWQFYEKSITFQDSLYTNISLSSASFRYCSDFNLQGGPKNLAPFFLYALTLPNINRFSQLFHCQNQEKICNNAVAKNPTTPQVCHYTTL